MKIIIHRGSREIGGSCVEVATATTRVIVDLGMPLVLPWNKAEKLDSLLFARATTAELLANAVLPPVPGLYEGGSEGKPVTAVLLSHPHQDHYGLLRHIKPGLPVYMSAGAKAAIETSDMFLPTKACLRDPRIIKEGDRVPIGDITVTPSVVDHSAFDALAFVIEGEGRRVFYSGDIRGHGRKKALFDRLCRRPPENIDCLLLEGTTLGRPGAAVKTEEAVQADIENLARKWPGLKLVYASAQNVDRLVSFYKAAMAMNGTLAVDLYTAYFLENLKTPSIPHPSHAFPRLRVFFTRYLMKKIARLGRKDLFARYRPYEISPGEIQRDPGRVFLMYRDSLEDDVAPLDCFRDSVLIYSQYNGYRREPSFAPVEQFLTENGIALEPTHTSGHACRKDLERLIKAIAPRVLVPIHTFHPGGYYELWRSVLPLRDGEELDLDEMNL